MRKWWARPLIVWAGLVLTATLNPVTGNAEYRGGTIKIGVLNDQSGLYAQGQFKEESGTVNAPIGRNPKNRDKMGIVPDGRHAVTHWKVLDRIGDKYALLELSLETGRTHQIRVHMAHIGHPLLGDPLYGSGVDKVLKLKTQGQLLQAFRLSFVHPLSNEQVTFEIPEDPEVTRVWQWLKGSD